MKFLCIHGHCYQPPREDPWLDEVDLEPSAWPYHDWNERIAAECYTPNTAARILDQHGQIRKISNNYSHISFDFGPTLVSWLAEKNPSTYRAILRADRESVSRFSEHGSAMALAYNHMILPLASGRDKFTQIHWGIQDFIHRFGRRPEGMWLPETAVDLESLDIMAGLGLKFTVLAPRQAAAVRASGNWEWNDVNGGRVDPSQPYRVNLPSGRTISAFFFDHPVSQAVSFDGLLANGENFIRRLMSGYSQPRGRAELLHIVTDGEVYGHHHSKGEMALAYVLDQMEARGLAKITNYGEYLEHHPPTAEVRIVENSSWSCAHGVERWRTHCGCNAGHSGWNQSWRAPLRDALDWLRDKAGSLYEAAASDIFFDPWEARNGYIHVVLDRSPDSQTQFKRKHVLPAMMGRRDISLWRLLEMQRHSMLMYTSCGWFFDEISGIETVQVIRHAARVVELARAALNEDLEPQFCRRLALAKSNLSEHGDGARIYHKFAKPRQPIELEVPIAKERYSQCRGLGALHAAVQRGGWPNPELESGTSLIQRIRESGLRDAEASYIQHTEEIGSLGRWLRDLKIYVPRVSSAVAERALNSLLRRAFAQEKLDSKRIHALVQETRVLNICLDAATIECIRTKMARLSCRCSDSPENIEFLAELNEHVEPLASSGGFPEALWAAQNVSYELLQNPYPQMKLRSQQGDRASLEWIQQFSLLTGRLAIRMQ